MTKISRVLKHLVMLPLCALFFFIGAVTVQAATYYVAHTGNDARTCVTAQTITTPKQTFASAMNCLAPGDTLYIRAGTWTESIDTDTTVGTEGKPITIAAYPGDTVTLQPVGRAYAIVPRHLDYLIFDGLIWDGINMDRSGNGVFGVRVINTSHVTFQNMEFKRLWGLIYISGSDNVTIRNCKIHDFLTETGEPGTRYMGIYGHDGINLLIEGNDIYDNPGGGMQIQPGPWNNVIVRNNKIHHNVTLSNQPSIGGIIVWASLSGGGPITGVQIYNNLVYNNGLGAGHIVGTNYAPGINISNATSGAKVWNNTVYGNSGYGLSVQHSITSNTVLQNNISFNNTDGAIYNGGTGSIIDHNLTTNPSFVNAAAFEFNLQASSPAIDAGVPLSNVTTDIRNIRRPQGVTHDIGAHEVDNGSDSTPPISPQGLRIN